MINVENNLVVSIAVKRSILTLSKHWPILGGPVGFLLRPLLTYILEAVFTKTEDGLKGLSVRKKELKKLHEFKKLKKTLEIRVQVGGLNAKEKNNLAKKYTDTFFDVASL